ERTITALVGNGIKFTKQGGVTVTLEVDEDLVLLHVADTGIGISNEFMPFLFEEFKQESEGLSRMHEGSGLGLSITKRLVELMKGDIMAESEKGQGTVFTVTLPRNGEAAIKSGDLNGQNGHVRPKVLVVEDNADTRTLVNHLLRKNYEVVCASDGDEALTLAAANNYDVLLVDINLGKGKSGEDVLHAVKSLPTYEDIPVIAVTAYAMPGDRERFFTEGFDDYVSKPFSKQRLLEALEAVLE
ncbi:MAG: ATP-binding protein, partial [Rhodothermales bacterium]